FGFVENGRKVANKLLINSGFLHHRVFLKYHIAPHSLKGGPPALRSPARNQGNRSRISCQRLQALSSICAEKPRGHECWKDGLPREAVCQRLSSHRAARSTYARMRPDSARHPPAQLQPHDASPPERLRDWTGGIRSRCRASKHGRDTASR